MAALIHVLFIPQTMPIRPATGNPAQL